MARIWWRQTLLLSEKRTGPSFWGREGSALKKLSTAARLSMENFLGELALLSAEPWLIRLRHSIITSSTFWASGVQCPC